MSLASDVRTLFHMTLRPIRGASHAERLESFYGSQAADYDSYREHLLKGRRELYESLDPPTGAVWVEMGGGTGRNLEFLGERLGQLGHIYIVDLSTSLLERARRRIAERGWSNVTAVQADVTRFTPPEGHADVVTFSYSLTMIPDWFAAVQQAQRLLRPGGTLAVVDFYVSRKYPAEGQRRHGWLTRSFWPVWLALDNVYPNADHVPYLHHHFEPVQFAEESTRMRYFPLLRVPYYRFVGKRGKTGIP